MHTKSLLQKLGAIAFLLGFWVLCIYVSINQALGAPNQIFNFEDNSLVDANQCIQGLISGSASIQSSVKRTGTYAFQSNPTGSNAGIASFPGINTTTGVTANQNLGTTTWFRGYFRADLLPASGSDSILFFTSSSTGLKNSLRINSTGNIIVTNEVSTVVLTSSATVSTGNWYKIDFQSGMANPSPYALYMDDVLQGSGTMNQGGTFNGFLFLGRSSGLAPSGNAVNFYWDDILIDDANRSGGGGGVILLPDAAGSVNDYTAGTGASNYTQINQVPVNSTAYVQKSAASSQSIMVDLESTISKGIPAGSTINAVKVFGSGYNTAFASADVATGVRLNCASSNVSSGTNVDRSNNLFCHELMLTTCPGTGAAFTTSNLDTTQIGFFDTSSQSTARGIETYLYVDFATPSPTPTPTNTPTPTPTATPTSTPTVTATPTVSGGRGSLLLLGVGK